MRAGSGGDPISIPHENFGPYRVVRPLGEGGMGTVLLAEQTGPVQRQVAVKVLRADRDAGELVTRLEVERQAMAMLDHPGIAKVFEAGTTKDGRPYFVMEYFDGAPVTRWCDSARASVEQRLELFCLICDAVQSAHQHGLIHRDLTPNNILVREVGSRPIVKVIDFGLVKALGRKLTDKTLHTEAGQQLGTPEYMSPEQAEGAAVDTRTDVYSLGVVLYELLSGALPFESRRLREAGVLELLRILREEEPPTPSSRITSLGEIASDVAAKRSTGPRSLSRRVRGDLDCIVAKATAKDRRERYPGVSELAADVRRHLDGEAVLAGPPSTIYRLRKLVRRHRIAFGVTAGFVLVLVVALLVIAGAWREAAENLQRFESLVGQDRLTELIRAAEEDLWPATPEQIPKFERWLEDARSFAARNPSIDNEIVELRRRSGVHDSDADRWTFAHTHEATLHAALVDLRAKAARLTGNSGLIRDVERRHAWAQDLGKITVEDCAEAWDDSIATARDRFGIELAPQVGLVPLGSDPDSTLLEFAVRTAGGVVPARDDRGQLARNGEDWEIVLVLIPGGLAKVGAELQPGEPDHDPHATAVEGPPIELTLAPYFVSKFEITQAQWSRVMGLNPSTFRPKVSPLVRDLTHPVEQVSWSDAMRFCRRLGLELPTEPQWEHAARGGSPTPWANASTPEALFGGANLFGSEGAETSWSEGLTPQANWSDPFVVHAPVGSFRANGYGLHDVHGNVWEWCGNELFASKSIASGTVSSGDGNVSYPDVPRNTGDGPFAPARGGSFLSSAERSRVTTRMRMGFRAPHLAFGFRPVRAVAKAVTH